jgi:hypothetical protein
VPVPFNGVDNAYRLDAVAATAVSKVYAAAAKGMKGRKKLTGKGRASSGRMKPHEDGRVISDEADTLPLSRS